MDRFAAIACCTLRPAVFNNTSDRQIVSVSRKDQVCSADGMRRSIIVLPAVSDEEKSQGGSVEEGNKLRTCAEP